MYNSLVNLSLRRKKTRTKSFLDRSHTTRGGESSRESRHCLADDKGRERITSCMARQSLGPRHGIARTIYILIVPPYAGQEGEEKGGGDVKSEAFICRMAGDGPSDPSTSIIDRRRNKCGITHDRAGPDLPRVSKRSTSTPTSARSSLGRKIQRDVRTTHP